MINESEQIAIDEFFGDVESQELYNYPKEVDSIIDYELCNIQNIDYVQKEVKSVYHPATYSVTSTNDSQKASGPFVDSNRIIAIIATTNLDEVKSWYFGFDSNWVYDVHILKIKSLTSPSTP